jgi:hypothetical protein
MYKFVMLAALGLVSGMGLLGSVEAGRPSIQAGANELAPAKYQIGDAVWIWRGNKWVPGHVKSIASSTSPGQPAANVSYLVSYDNWTGSDWVKSDRLSPR